MPSQIKSKKVVNPRLENVPQITLSGQSIEKLLSASLLHWLFQAVGRKRSTITERHNNQTSNMIKIVGEIYSRIKLFSQCMQSFVL